MHRFSKNSHIARASSTRRHMAQMCAAALILPSPFSFAQNNAKGLLIQSSDWQMLRERLVREPDLAAYHLSLMEEAKLQLPVAPVVYEKTGRRLLTISRRLLQRVLLWSYAFKMSGQMEFAQRAEQEMLAACNFPDWNPSHFLDVAEATAAMALGYDWLGETLPAASRERIALAIHDFGLKKALEIGAKHNTWHRSEHNWNQVCFGGMTLGALAVRAVYPETSRAMLALAREGIVHGLKPYAPDGVYPEGPSYWSYGTSYQVLMVAALRSVQGNAWNIEQAPGFLASAQAYVQMISTTRLPFNFSDGAERVTLEPALFWLAKELGQPNLLQFEMQHLATTDSRRRAIRGERFAPLAVLWWPRADHIGQPLPLAWHGRGDNPLVIVRSSWTNPDSLYFAIKGGSASLNHAHMDVGSFVFELDGIRWGIDLGLQNYESLESKGVDLWNKKQNSQRWQVFRLNNHSHSTLTIDGRLHEVAGQGKFSSVRLEGPEPLAVLEMSSVFLGQASKVQRSVQVKQSAVLIRDELEGLRPGTRVRWQMPTRASIALNGARAVLRQSNRQLQALMSEGSHEWMSLSLEKPLPEFNAPNPGVSMLACEAIAGSDGLVRIAVQLGAG
jgi:oligo-alginate lyase